MSGSGNGYAGRHRERAEALQRASSATRRRRSSGAALSSLLAQQPSSYDGRKIAAVDKNIESLDALPERYAGVKTLYLSKNALRSLAGVEQFRELKALSAADNLLTDLDCLQALPAAGIALEAASFEGNPIADLPNYRAHVIHVLGPSLAVLDNRPVAAEERSSAAAAVAHEATMLALMTSNACLVHKLGRAVQLVRLHCELQCAVLGGQYAVSCAGGEAPGTQLCSGRGINRVLQLWDYESTLGRQERHAIGLAIRREVGRRYRKLAPAGGKPEGSTKQWQQAFAQVMLLQQETIASLMGLLEEAKAETAASLAPLTRPASPTKRAALESQAEAQSRVLQDREALIQELRDAFLGLADAPAHANSEQRSAHLEARIRELHTALEAAGDKPQHLAELPSPQAVWSIPAVRPGAEPASPTTVRSPVHRRVGSASLKSALRQQQHPSSDGWSPARPGRGGAAPQRPASALPGGPAVPLSRPGVATAATWQQQQQQQQQQQLLREPLVLQQQQRQQWQADDGLAVHEEQARCQTPRPFQGGRPASAQAPQAQEASRHVQASGIEALQQQPVRQQMASRPPFRPASACAAGSPMLAPPGGPMRPPSGGPPEWMPYPLARTISTVGSAGGGSPGAGSPRKNSLQEVLRLLEREGRVIQLEALRSTVAQYETHAAELEAGNTELAEALQQVQQHACELEEKLAAQRDAAEKQAAAAAAQVASLRHANGEQQAAAHMQQAEAETEQRQQVQQLQELGCKLNEAVASRQALQAQLEVAAAEQKRLLKEAAEEREGAAALAQRERAAAAAAESQLMSRVAELEGQKAVHLSMTVQSYEEEWLAEVARANALEERAVDLSVRLAAHQQREHVKEACTQLAGRAVLRRMLYHWRDAASESAYRGAMQQQGMSLHRRHVLAAWLAKWRLAVQRSQQMAALQAQRERRQMQGAWQVWCTYQHGCVVNRGLEAAGHLHRQSALQRQAFVSWQAVIVTSRQVELPYSHPTMQAAARSQRLRLLRTFFAAWRGHMAEHVLPRMAAVQLRVLEQFMGSQRRALAAWQQYVQQRREGKLLQGVAQEHRLQCLLLHWRQVAQECKEQRAATLRAAFTSQKLLLRRGWRAWQLAVQEKRQRAQHSALAEQHLRQKLLAGGWAKWQEWTALCWGMRQRRAAHLQTAAFAAWRQAVKVAEKRRMAVAFYQRSQQRRFRASLAAWRTAVAAAKARRHQVAHARALLARRLSGRVIAGWRRAALAGKLYQTLDLVHELQGAVERARDELEHKAQQVDALSSMQVTFEGTSDSLSLRVSSLDADLATAQRQAAELQEAADAAQADHEAAAAALEQVLADRAAVEAEGAAAVAERDAAVAAKEVAESERAAARLAQQAAERQACEATGRAEATAAAVAAATARADEASAALRALSEEHALLAVQLAEVQAEKHRLAADLKEAVSEVQHTAGLLQRLEAERDKLRVQREQAETAVVNAAAEQQAALKQAERLTQLCEDQQQQCQRLQQQVVQLRSSLADQSALQADLAQLGELNTQLLADNESMRIQVDSFAASVQRAEGTNTDLLAAAEAAAEEQRRLHERCQAAEAEALRLGRLADSLRGTQASLERQLAAAREEADQAVAQQEELAAAVVDLTGERDTLSARVAGLSDERDGLEGTVEHLRGQLLESNEVLETCRRMLADTCSVQSAADQQAASLTELLRSVQAQLMLKDASIKSLTRENAQRAERLRALQAQVAALSPPAGGGLPAQQAQQLGAGMHGPEAGSMLSSGGGEMGGRRSSVVARPGSPAAGLHQAAACTWALTGGMQAYSSLHLHSARPAGSSSPSSGTGANRQQPAQYSFPSAAAASPAPSYISLPSPPPWQHGTATASPHTGADPLSSASIRSRSASLPSAASASSTSSIRSRAASVAFAQLPSGGSGNDIGGGAAGGMSSSALPAGLHDQQMSYLLDLVAAKRITAGQAQQVINAGVEGDARPLLQMLTAVQQQAEASSGVTSQQTAAPVPATGPVTSEEVAAVRRAIHKLASRGAPAGV